MKVKKLSTAISVLLIFILLMSPASIFADSSDGITQDNNSVLQSQSVDRENYKLTTSETVNGVEKQKYIILFKNTVDEEALANANADINCIYTCIPAASILIAEDEIDGLRNNQNVVSLEPDNVVQVETQTIDWGIAKTNAQSAWNSGYTGQGVKIAIIDTGIDRDHPDLNVAGGTSCVSYTSDYDDDDGHGTHVAGIIAAQNNTRGNVGIAPGASIYAVKVLDFNGGGLISDIIEGIQWAINNHMDIINLSLGDTESNATLEAVVNQAYSQGILVVAAAGNSGNASGTGDNIAYPARYASVIAVGATDIDNIRAEFSCTGPALEIAAPGVDIYSTYFTGSYVTMSGTSMACPYVCGDLALLKQANPTYTNAQLRALLQQSAIDLGTAGRDSKYGYGLIQAPTQASTKYYTVTFNSNGGTAISSIVVEENTKITAPANPTKTNYTFGGWYKDNTYSTPWYFDSDTVTSNMTLYAKWNINTFTVTFDSQGADSIEPITAAYGSTITAPLSPIREGYEFQGWYKEAACTNIWNFSSSTVTTNITLYAKWKIVYFQGQGTQESPYLIYTKTDLQNLASLANSGDSQYINSSSPKYYRMENDIDISGSNWTPIGSTYSKQFYGYFDGNNHKVIGLQIVLSSSSTTSYYGLFGFNNGTIKNLGLIDTNINITSDYAKVGGIVGCSTGEILNCYNTGSVKITSSSPHYGQGVGGITGECYGDDGKIINCYNTATVTGSYNVGGIIGLNNGLIDNCYNAGTINGVIYNYVLTGGIVGDNAINAVINNCYNTGTINGDHYSGGITGYNRDHSTITNCYNLGTINDIVLPGGIAGLNQSNSVISRCYNKGLINGGNFSGGISGKNDISSTIEYCYNANGVIGSNSTGGITGVNAGNSIIRNCYNTAALSGKDTGGIAGSNETSSVTYCYNTGSVSATEYAGGIAGKNIENTTYKISGSYYLNNIAVPVGNGSGTATSRTLQQMQQQSNFSAFDFTNNWIMPNYTSTPLIKPLYSPISGISFNDSANGILIGESITLSADIQPTNATNKNITWSSSDINIATVSDTGLVNGLSKGTVTITITTQDGNLIAQKTLDIIQPVTAIELNTNSVDLDIGNQIQLTETVSPEDANNKTVIWSSDNAQIAEVSNSGLVTAINAGQAVITAKTISGEKIATCEINVLGMTVSTLPKTSFYKSEPLDATGGIITLYKAGGETEYINITNDMVSGYNSSQLGAQTLTVTYNVYSATYEITVNNLAVSFDTDGGSAIDSISTDYNTLIIEPAQPEKIGYALEGWYSDEQLTNSWNFAEDKVTQDTTLYAKWSICSYNVTFESKGGSEVIGLVNQVFNSLITAPTEPSKQHYSFAGWFKEDSCTNQWDFNSDTVPGDNFTLYAKWTPDSHTIDSLANNSSYGAITGAGQYDYDSQATLTAVPNEKYRFVCWIDNGEEVSSDYSYTFTVTGDRTVVAVFDTIQTPVLSSAVSGGYNSVCLTWSAVDGVSGYDIYSSVTSTGTYDKIGASDTTDFTDNNLTPGKYYYYKIKAKYSAGEVNTYSSFSNYLSAKPIPSAPTINVSSYSYTSLQLTWSAVDGANGYQIYRSLSSTGTYSLVTTTSLTSYINSGLVTGKNYYYKVIAYSTVGTTKIYGAYSLPMYAKPVPPTPNASCVSAGFNSIKISWASVSGATKYEIYRSPNDIGTYTLIGSTTLASYIDKDLAAGLMYYYKVVAYHLEGTAKIYGSYSNSVSAIPVPLAPVAKAQSASYNSINITWNEIVGANWYEVYQTDTQTQMDNLIATVSSLSTSYVHKNLTPGASYSYKIRAYRVSGFGELYSPYSEVTSAIPIPSTPSIKVTLNSYNSLNISWDGIEGADGYEIYRSTSSTGTFEQLTPSEPIITNSYLDSSLTTGTTYYYKVVAYHSDNPKIIGSESNIAGLKVIPTTPIITVTPTSYNSLTINWNSVEGATGYRIFRSTSSSGTYASVTTVTSGTSYINSGLATGTTYYYKILAYRTEGTVTTNSAYSAVKYAKVVPAAPGGISAQSASATGIKITWNKVSGATGYTVYRSLLLDGTYATVATVSYAYDYYTNTGLATGTTYYYKVASYRLVGTTKVYGAASEIVSAMPESSMSQALSLFTADMRLSSDNSTGAQTNEDSINQLKEINNLFHYISLTTSKSELLIPYLYKLSLYVLYGQQ